MSKRHKIDSIQEEIRVIQASTKQIEPPAHVHLFDEARPFFEAIIKGRERASWTDCDIETAVTLSNTRANITALMVELEEEGDIVNGRRNPRHLIIENLFRRDIALTRLLHLHPAAREARRRTIKEKTLLDSLPADDEFDYLLAQPLDLDDLQ